jgi:predicted RNA-binding protein YlqC (UPF0109 family)
MDTRISKLASSLKQIGEIQVAEWDFMGLLNTEIHELELARSLRRLGAIKVTDWEFTEVLPAIRQTANREVDLAGIFRKAARTKIMERDFNLRNGRGSEVGSPPPHEDAANRERVKQGLGNFLQFVVANLVDEPDQAGIQAKEMGPSGLCFQVTLAARDVAVLIGREGHTAAAIRRILQATGGRQGVQVLLHIQAHDEAGSDA